MQERNIFYVIYYFIFTAQFAFIAVFLPLYLKYLGYSTSEIGYVLTISTAVGISSPLIANYLFSSRFKNYTISALNILPFFSMLILPSCTSLSHVIIILTVQSIFTGSNTITDAQLISDQKQNKATYKYARVAASLGFIIGGIIIGKIYDFVGVEYLPYIAAINSLLVFLAGRRITPFLDITPSSGKLFPKVPDSLKYKVIAVAFAWGSHAAMFMYFSVYLKYLGFGGSALAYAWALGVFAEILLFIYYPVINRYFSSIRLLTFGIGVTIIRWLILGYSTSNFIVMTSQVLHAFSFAIVYMAIFLLVDEAHDSKNKVSGQAILQSYAFGIGALAGRLLMTFIAMYLAEESQLPWLFRASAILAIIAYIILLLEPVKYKTKAC